MTERAVISLDIAVDSAITTGHGRPFSRTGQECARAGHRRAAPLLELARERTVVLLGHEHEGVPDEAWELIDDVVQIPMIGRGSSLNVAVAGSLVLYRLAAMA